MAENEPVTGGVNAPSEISDLELSVHPKEKVFRLDVPMDHMLSMKIS